MRLLKDCWKSLRALFELGPAGWLRWRTGADHYLLERYGIEEKPEGWNDAVLGHFHRGPELREPGEEYHRAFAERTKMPLPGAFIP